MGNLISTIIRDVDNLFRDSNSNSNISRNSNLDLLNNNLAIQNNIVKDNFGDINYELAKINYKDNDIKKTKNYYN